MNAFSFPSGNLLAWDLTMCAARWGGGAEAGKTHVFLSGGEGWFRSSHQCVVDDFGNLVAVD